MLDMTTQPGDVPPGALGGRDAITIDRIQALFQKNDFLKLCELLKQAADPTSGVVITLEARDYLAQECQTACAIIDQLKRDRSVLRAGMPRRAFLGSVAGLAAGIALAASDGISRTPAPKPAPQKPEKAPVIAHEKTPVANQPPPDSFGTVKESNNHTAVISGYIGICMFLGAMLGLIPGDKQRADLQNHINDLENLIAAKRALPSGRIR